MKVKIFILILLICFSDVFAQENSVFFAEIPNSKYIPEISHDANGKLMGSTKTGNKSLDNLINSYKIYDVNRVFKNSNQVSLQNIYMIICNDLALMDNLYNNYKTYYPRVENATGKTLLDPNDFGTNGGYTVDDQEELNFIRAKEAWDITTGSSDIIIGVADTNFMTNHEDLINTLTVAVNASSNNINGHDHGSRVASNAAAETDNSKGIAAIGHQSYIYGGVGLNASVLDDLSQLDNVKVVNASWYDNTSTNPPTITNTLYADINDRGVVTVAAAGNGGGFDATKFYYPASHNNVISVSAIGHKDITFDYGDGVTYQVFHNGHDRIRNGVSSPFQHNDSIDIVAPGYHISEVKRLGTNVTNGYGFKDQGTSLSAPIVAGTIALMFDVNYCIDPKEVETILKLTAIKIDTLPQNLSYHGKLGAGKLDAYKAVKMAKDMAEPYGTVEVKNRILYRPWFYKLVTAPYEIKMDNNDVSAQAKIKFRARNNIEILSGDYYPSSGGYIDLKIDESIALNCPPAPTMAKRGYNININNIKEEKIYFEVFPTLIEDGTEIVNYALSKNSQVDIKVYNLYGIEVYDKKRITAKKVKLNLSKLTEGIYVIKIFNSKGSILHTQRVIKK
ncbi:S8 family peptidase [Winogradskyella echinorum]|uniref:S8 family peptidase n=1 Tax=Winogradskyella echinorum TaxID=538189 RepID=A0ABR6XWG0_9FLAO|nr:S8 family peptidase [Winogradskyella echinorum]MBC3844830.1 S8 family peptidase [Winogradskyella echinorum]MBC5749178.1 S8 family peptidase [Winogradskyella echinorum]